jgi:hypothetical protein
MLSDVACQAASILQDWIWISFRGSSFMIAENCRCSQQRTAIMRMALHCWLQLKIYQVFCKAVCAMQPATRCHHVDGIALLAAAA